MTVHSLQADVRFFNARLAHTAEVGKDSLHIPLEKSEVMRCFA